MTTREEAHTCHARGCGAHVKPEFLMCARHWYTVPERIRQAVWRTYRPGQCDDMSPSESWHVAADAAIGFVAAKEGKAVRRSEVEALTQAGYSYFPEEPIRVRPTEKK